VPVIDKREQGVNSLIVHMLGGLISLPHKVSDSECYVNGIEDILAWKGRSYADHLLSVVGGMTSFSSLKYKRARPPNMVFWGTSTRYFVPNLERIIGFKQVLMEGSSSSNALSKLKGFIDEGKPVVAGALDMYYLHYYPDLYRNRHVPIHYVLVVGYDDERRIFYIHDCGRANVQEVPYEDLQMALDVKVPGMSKKNTLRTFEMPSTIPSELEVAVKGFRFKANQMLYPPVKIFGIPAMRRLSKEVLSWKDRESFEHMVMYATTPPIVPESFENSHGMRHWQSAVLRDLAKRYDIGIWEDASKLFEQSGELIIQVCEAALKQNNQRVAELLLRIADAEELAYHLLQRKP